MLNLRSIAIALILALAFIAAPNIAKADVLWEYIDSNNYMFGLYATDIDDNLTGFFSVDIFILNNSWSGYELQIEGFQECTNKTSGASCINRDNGIVTFDPQGGSISPGGQLHFEGTFDPTNKELFNYSMQIYNSEEFYFTSLEPVWNEEYQMLTGPVQGVRSVVPVAPEPISTTLFLVGGTLLGLQQYRKRK